MKYCKNYQTRRQRHVVSKCCWKNSMLDLLHFKLPHTLELWKMQYLPNNKGKHSKTRPALYCSLGSGVVRTNSQFSPLPPNTHTHTHTVILKPDVTCFPSSWLWVAVLPVHSYLFTLPFLTVYSFPCAALTWTVKKVEPQILSSAVCPDRCRCLVLSPQSFFCLIIQWPLSPPCTPVLS